MAYLYLALLICFSPLLVDGQQPVSGSLHGTIADKTGAAISGAQVILSIDNVAPDEAVSSSDQQVLSNSDGTFIFNNVAPGAFHANIKADGFSAQVVSGTMHSAETLDLPQIVLNVAPLTTDVNVTLTQKEIAHEEVKVQEQQRLLGFVPNFAVNYFPNFVPITASQKMDLSWKAVYDPFSFVVNGVIAGVQQARNSYPGFGQGAAGYAKRYGASYGTFVTGTMLSSAILPALFKQDPRYHYKGTGTIRARLLYAISRSVIRDGDNGKPQFNYSGILGSLAAGGISNLYYPSENRNGAGTTFQNTLISIGGDSLGHIFDEFASRKLMSKKSQNLSSGKT